jgi:nucleoside-diphosphate-sugar epimerase
MRILVAGATGVLGQATLPHLGGHDVIGLTRTQGKLELLRDLGAEGIVCDVYDSDALRQVAQRARPHIVVNFLTDLASGIGDANNRVRREGASNLVSAAVAAEAQRLVVESVAFLLEGDSADALEQMEQTALDAPLEVLILRFGRLWGHGTWYDEPPRGEAVHIDEAATRAAELLTSAPAGTYVITGGRDTSL